MKKLLIILLVLVFAGAVLSRNAFAMEERPLRADYKLAYPGMLPDSPLYIIKTIRDRLVGILITGPVNKSFYFLLQADKRLLAGKMLVEKGNKDLGVTTIVGGEEYFSQAVNEAEEARKQGLDTSDLVSKLLVAVNKHGQVLESIGANVSGTNFKNIEKAIILNQKSKERVLELTTSD